jgi:nitrite reductase/ring-hydroxylating ferredoxin subunit
MTTKSEPLWRDEFSVESAEERYVTRRQFGKFLVLTSLGMLTGNAIILVRSWFRQTTAHPPRVIAGASEIPVGGVKQFHYPGPHDACLLIRRGENDFVAYSQKCTHLSCAVFYEKETERLVCPCHHGYFSARDGRVLQGPPPRALPRIDLERRGDEIVATGLSAGETEGG